MPFSCLPKVMYFHFDLFEWTFAFSDANMPFDMPVRGGQPPSKCSQSQKCLNLIQGGRSSFFKNIWNSKISQLSSLIGNFPKFSRFFLWRLPLYGFIDRIVIWYNLIKCIAVWSQIIIWIPIWDQDLMSDCFSDFCLRLRWTSNLKNKTQIASTEMDVDLK